MAIKTNTGFEIGSIAPIDSRIALTTEQMRNINDDTQPDKYFAVNQDDGQLYIYNKDNEKDAETGRFRLFKSGGEAIDHIDGNFTVYASEDREAPELKVRTDRVDILKNELNDEGGIPGWSTLAIKKNAVISGDENNQVTYDIHSNDFKISHKDLILLNIYNRNKLDRHDNELLLQKVDFNFSGNEQQDFNILEAKGIKFQTGSDNTPVRTDTLASRDGVTQNLGVTGHNGQYAVVAGIGAALGINPQYELGRPFDFGNWNAKDTVSGFEVHDDGDAVQIHTPYKFAIREHDTVTGNDYPAMEIDPNIVKLRKEKKNGSNSYCNIMLANSATAQIYYDAENHYIGNGQDNYVKLTADPANKKLKIEDKAIALAEDVEITYFETKAAWEAAAAAGTLDPNKYYSYPEMGSPAYETLMKVEYEDGTQKDYIIFCKEV